MSTEPQWRQPSADGTRWVAAGAVPVDAGCLLRVRCPAGWYRQRADDCDDAELKAVLVHNMNDEVEHAAMLVEWLRRNVAEFATQLSKFMGTSGPIT